MVKEINRDMICNDHYTEAAESKETVMGGLTDKVFALKSKLDLNSFFQDTVNILNMQFMGPMSPSVEIN